MMGLKEDGDIGNIGDITKYKYNINDNDDDDDPMNIKGDDFASPAAEIDIERFDIEESINICDDDNDDLEMMDYPKI